MWLLSHFACCLSSIFLRTSCFLCLIVCSYCLLMKFFDAVCLLSFSLHVPLPFKELQYEILNVTIITLIFILFTKNDHILFSAGLSSWGPCAKRRWGRLSSHSQVPIPVIPLTASRLKWGLVPIDNALTTTKFSECAVHGI